MHATLLDSHVRILEQVLRPFTPDERDRYCSEAAVFAEVLGAPPDDLPRTWRELQDFIAAQIESGRVTVGADARALAPAILRPAFGWLLWPLQSAGELVTIGSLPPAIRDGYGFAWNATTGAAPSAGARDAAGAPRPHAGLVRPLARGPST